MSDRLLVCFDLDGVIVDSSLAIPAAINAGLQAVGLRTMPASELVQYIGPPLLQTFRTLLVLLGHDPAIAAACLAAYRRHYPQFAAKLTRVYPDVPAMLCELADVADLLVVTSKPAAFAVPILEVLGLAAHFRGVFAPALNELAESKAVTLRRALACLRSDSFRGQGVMVGDRHHDVEAGLVNGLTTIGVLWGFGSREELVEAHVHILAESPLELPGRIREVGRR